MVILVAETRAGAAAGVVVAAAEAAAVVAVAAADVGAVAVAAAEAAVEDQAVPPETMEGGRRTPIPKAP